LKLGKLNYLEGVHEPYKILLRTVKCSATTAKDFGMRVAGLKVYRPHTLNYVVRQKTWGNQLKRKDFHKAINMYLHNGVRTRVDVIPHFIDRLKLLSEALKQQATFSFMASSILLIYEGNTSDDVDQHIDIRLIDFDHTMVSKDGSAQDVAGVVFGVKSLIHILKKILFSEQMSHSESNLYNLRAGESATVSIEEQAASATEPSFLAQRHLPNHPFNTSKNSKANATTTATSTSTTNIRNSFENTGSEDHYSDSIGSEDHTTPEEVHSSPSPKAKRSGQTG